MRSLLMVRFTRGNVELGGHYCSRVIRRAPQQPCGHGVIRFTVTAWRRSRSARILRRSPMRCVCPKPTMTVYLKRLVAAKLVRR
jgi:hypothetical protein